MRTITLAVYSYDELSDQAKAKARDWWRQNEAETFDGDYPLEDAARAAKLLGIELGERVVRLAGGHTRKEPDIRWSGFGSQGDGASFTGSYRSRHGAGQAIRAEFPLDTELHAIADGFDALEANATAPIRAEIDQKGRYVHDKTMSIETENEDVADELLKLFRRFARWVYALIQSDWEYRSTDAYLEEAIRSNECEFYSDGTVAL